MFKKIKHRKFDYKPRYYDAQKEDLNNRLKRYDSSIPESDRIKSRIQSGFKSRIKSGAAPKSSLKSNLRLLYIIVILVFLTYLILTSDKFMRFVEWMG